MAHVGLAKALDRWGKRGECLTVLKKAKALLVKTTAREKAMLQSALIEHGLNDNPPAAGELRLKAAAEVIDQALSVYEDDQELWFTRAQIACNYRTFGGSATSAPYYKALCRINPVHPGANHELLHFHEGQQRPSLGWPHAEAYLLSSPGIPHASHMQAHLATRIGKWAKTSDRSTRAVELETAYHKDMSVKPSEDSQFEHHVQTLLLSLTHDGRFKEAQELARHRKEGKQGSIPWFRLYLHSQDWGKAAEEAARFSKNDKATASYLNACLFLAKKEPHNALPCVESLQQAWSGGKKDQQAEFRMWETQACLMAAQGQHGPATKLIKRAVDKSKNDYSHHAWGNGAYYMEIWGLIALQGKDYPEAEEAFLEALAHDPGSVRGALGLRRLCEVLGRKEESARYEALARRSWGKADSGVLEKEWQAIKGLVPDSTIPTAMR